MLTCALLLGLLASPATVAPAAAAEPVAVPSTPLDPDEALATATEVLAGEAGSGTELTPVLRDLWLARDALAPADRRLARSLLAPPVAAVAHPLWRYPQGTVPVRTCGTHVCVTHVTTSRHAATPAYAAEALSLLGTTWRRVVDELGYRAPATGGPEGPESTVTDSTDTSDGTGEEGGHLDVYLADLSAEGVYGFCAPTELVPGQSARASSYCVLDNDMAGLGTSPRAALAVTAAHEFFHAVQFNYDVAEDPWFMEASATWVERLVFPEHRDNHQYLRHGQLGSPRVPLDSPTARYGNWIFVQFLAQRRGSDVVRRVWERLDATAGAPDDWSLAGIRHTLAASGDDWARAYADFARANLTPTRHYRGLGRLPTAPYADRIRLGRRVHSDTRDSRLPHLSSHSLRVAVGGLPQRRRALRLEVRVTRRAYARVQVVVHRKGGGTTLRRLRLGAHGKARLRVPARRLSHVVVLTSHTGAAHRNCGNNTGWACGGEPVGDLAVRVRARLVR